MIVDVGANFGEFAIEMAKRNPNQLVIAIEPIPDLCMKINTKISTENISNIKVLQYAIDTIERIDYLNVASHHDWGVSSLLEFDESKIKEDEYWKTRSDMYFDTKIEVEVKKLESIFDYLSLEEQIDFIKIDAQGLDFNVLKSVGKYISFIEAGMIEVSVSTKLGLYENENYALIDILNWLEENELESYALKPNDPASNEFNLYFCKKGINHHDIESVLNLKNMHLYDGKFYWHHPSNKLENIDSDFNNLKIDLQRHIDLVHQRDEVIDNLKIDLQRHIDLVQKFQSGVLYRIKRKIVNLLNELKYRSKK